MTLAESHRELLGQDPQSHTSMRSMLTLLCYSYGSRLLVPARNSTVPEFIANAKLAFSFLSQLLRLCRNLDLTCPNTQRLMGFEPVESNSLIEAEGEESTSPEFWIHSTSLMFEDAQNVPGAPAPTLSALGLSSVVSSELDTRRLVVNAIYNVLRSEVRTMHNAANLSRYLYPCLDFAIFGRCNRSDCGRQEVNSYRIPDEQRQFYFNQRAQALIIETQIIQLYQAQTHLDEGERRDFRR